MRHAERTAITYAGQDAHLTPKGWDQAKQIGSEIASKHLHSTFDIYSSPKQRCLDTLEPLITNLKQPINELELLGDYHQDNLTRYKLVISHVIQQVLNAKRTTQNTANQTTQHTIILCGHGDFLPDCLRFLTGARTQFNMGAYATVRLSHLNGSLLLKSIQDVTLLERHALLYEFVQRYDFSTSND